MRLVAWPNKWDPEEGIGPVEAQGVTLHATSTDLEELAAFFNNALIAVREHKASEFFARLSDSKPNPLTGIMFDLYIE